MGAPVARASSTGPGLATYLGPRGPSIVNATVEFCPISFRIPRRARTAPRLLEPRTFTKPNLRIMRPVHSPSKLSLLMTRICRLRQTYIAGKIQLCQKERIMGRVSRFGGAPSSNETATRRLGPMRRMTRNPVHVIRYSAIRCQSGKGRADVEDGGG